MYLIWYKLREDISRGSISLVGWKSSSFVTLTSCNLALQTPEVLDPISLTSRALLLPLLM